MKNLKSILLVFTIVLFASCKKNDTVKEFSKSEGFGANVYLEAQSDILLAGNSFKMPVTYWLPNTEIDSLSLRETKDSTIELSFKQIAGSTFAYGTQFFGNIDSNKVYSVYTHTEDNWSDAHYSYRLHADYNSTSEMSASYKEKFTEVNDFITQPGSNSDSIISKITYDYATQMTKDQLHRSVVSVSTQEEFDALWGGLTVDGVDYLYNKFIKRQRTKDEMLEKYYPYNNPLKGDYGVKYLFGKSYNQMVKIFATKRPKTHLGNVVLDANEDTVWLDNTPYLETIDELIALYSYDIPMSTAEVFIDNSISYEKLFDPIFDINYLQSARVIGTSPGSSSDPVYTKDELNTLFVLHNFVINDSDFNNYFTPTGDLIESETNNLVDNLKALSNEKLFGYKPKLKRIYSITLEFQVRGKDGVIGKSNTTRFNIK